MTVKAVVFDFDGVLADSEPIHLRVFQDLLAPAGVTLTKEIYCERYLGYDDVGMMQKVSEDYRLLLGDEEIEMIVAEKAKRFEALVGTSNVLYPAAEPLSAGGEAARRGRRILRRHRGLALGAAVGARRRNEDDRHHPYLSARSAAGGCDRRFAGRADGGAHRGGRRREEGGWRLEVGG